MADKGDMDGRAGSPGARGKSAPKRVDGFVYFIGSFGGPSIKIGHSVRPSERLATCRVGHERDLKLLAVIRGGEKVEKDLHRRFKRDKIRGEHFAPSGELLMLIWNAAATGEMLFNGQVEQEGLGSFLSQRAVRVACGRVKSSVLFAAFQEWCAAEGDRGWTQKAFSMAMRRSGFTSIRSNGMYWAGLQLRRAV